MRDVIITSILEGSDQKNHFFWGVVLVQVQQFGTALGMALKFCTSVTKGLKLKVRELWELIPTLVEVTGENWIAL